MATHKLLLLAGDGIGPEVMAEVKKLIAWMNAREAGEFETEDDLVGGCCYDAHKVAITDATMAKAHAADAVIFGAVGGPKWDKVAFRRAARSRTAAAAQGPRALRQPAASGNLSGARRRLLAQARVGRGPRRHDPARAHRRRVLRRAEDPSPTSATARSAPSTPRSTTPTRSSASDALLLNWRASAATRSPRWKSAT